jgi:hypothetical protein
MTKLRFVFVVIIFVMIFLGNSHVARADYENTDEYHPYFVSLGSNHALSLSLGGPENKWLGIEIGLLFDGHSENYIDEPCPSSYTIVGERNIGPSYGFDQLIYLPLTDEVSLFCGAGLYYQDYAVVSSSANGTRYCQSKDDRIDLAICKGIQIRFNNNCMLGIEYHTIRGYSLQFSFAQ